MIMVVLHSFKRTELQHHNIFIIPVKVSPNQKKIIPVAMDFNSNSKSLSIRVQCTTVTLFVSREMLKQNTQHYQFI